MAPMFSQSLRSRRTSDVSTPSKSRRHSHGHSTHSAPAVNLETVGSDDSSVFAGLGGFSPRDGPTISIRTPAPQSTRNQFKDDSRLTTKQVGTTNKAKSLERDHDEYDAVGTTMYNNVARSTSASSSEQSYLRSMKPMADTDSAFGDSVLNGAESVLDDVGYLQDQDVDSRLSCGSVHSYKKPRGTLKMISEVNFCDPVNEEDAYYGGESPTIQSERITAMLQDFERQMDANLASLTAEDDERDEVEVVLKRDYLSEVHDVVPSQVLSEDRDQTLTRDQTNKLQKILQQARAEVEVLKDNNEQFMSEIEQQEEEFESEKKLFEERARQKINDVKQMYQEEIENIIKEKDAAIVEASQQAVRYGESGRKQIASLKKQLEKVKSQANGIIRHKIEEAIKVIHTKKEEELSERLGALQKSYESKFEKLKRDREHHVQIALNQAVSAATRQMLTDRDRQINENVSIHCRQLELEKQTAVRSIKEALEQNQHQVSVLHQEKTAMIKTIESIKENICKHYPSQMSKFREKSRETRGPFNMPQSHHRGENILEDSFKEVIEIFGFLLEESQGVNLEVDELKNKLNEQKELVAGQRAEIQNLRKSQEEDKDKIESIENSLKILGREKKAVEEKYRIAIDSHNAEVDKLNAERNAIRQMEKRRKSLAEAMVVGELGLKQSKSLDRQHFLKPATPTHGSFRPQYLPKPSNHISFHTPVVHTHDDSLSLSACTMQSKMVDLTDNLETNTVNSIETGCVEANKSNDTINSFSRQLHFHRDSTDVIDVKYLTETEEFETKSTTMSPRENTIIPSQSRKENENAPEMPTDEEATELTDARKKSYAIRNFKRSNHQREIATAQKESKGNTMHSPQPQNRLTRAQKLKGLLVSGRMNENSSHTRDSLTDESLESLKTNTGTDATSKRENETGRYEYTSKEKRFTAMTRINARKRNPLGMFANTKKDSSFEQEGNSINEDSFDVPVPSNQSKNDSRNTAQAPIETPKDQSHESVQHHPMNFRKIPFPGFDRSSIPSHIIDGKKKVPMQEFGSIAEGSGSFADTMHSELSDQENKAPESASQACAKKDISCTAVIGHTMCLRPLSVENPKLQIQESASCMSDIQSLETASENILQGKMKNFPPQTNRSEDLSHHKQKKQSMSVSFINQKSPMRSTSNHSKPSVIQGRNISHLQTSSFVPPEEKISDALSPTSEATTAVVSHRYKPTFHSSLYSNIPGRGEKRVPVGYGTATTPRRAAKLASNKIRARRIRRFEV